MKPAPRLALALLAGHAQAEPVCPQFWAGMAALPIDAVGIRATPTGDADGCEATEVVVDLPGEYVPDWHAERVRLKGSALPWLTALIGSGSSEGLRPERLEVEVEGLRPVVATGNPQMDYLLAAQARANTIDGRLVLDWDAAARRLAVTALEADFPGDNLLRFSAGIDGVDLTDAAAMQMSVSGFALREASLEVRTHGLFEWYFLMSLGPSILPYDGDIEAAAAALRSEATAAVMALPEPVFDRSDKDALAALIAELPNPSGTLTLDFQARDGFGPARFMGYANEGLPDTLAAAAPLLDGVKVTIGWMHEESR